MLTVRQFIDSEPLAEIAFFGNDMIPVVVKTRDSEELVHIASVRASQIKAHDGSNHDAIVLELGDATGTEAV